MNTEWWLLWRQKLAAPTELWVGCRAPLPSVAVQATLLYSFPWARASNPLRAGMLHDTGNYFLHLIATMGDVIWVTWWRRALDHLHLQTYTFTVRGHRPHPLHCEVNSFPFLVHPRGRLSLPWLRWESLGLWHADFIIARVIIVVCFKQSTSRGISSLLFTVSESSFKKCPTSNLK